MGILKIPGLASGLDTDNLIKTLMSLERRPLTAMQTKRDQGITEANAWRDLNQRVLTLQKRIEELGSLVSTDYAARKSTSSDTSVASIAESRSTAANGSYAVEVLTLATATSWQSAQMGTAIDDPAKALNLAGKIKVSGGAKDGATLEIKATDTLNDIVKNINSKSADLGFTASVSQVNPGDYRLIIKGNNGAANDFKIVDDTGSTVAADLKLTEDTATKLATAANGSMKVNGTTVTFAENTVKDAVGGVTLTVNKAGTTTVTVSKDQGKVVDAVKKVVDQYNTVIDFMNDLTKYDKETKKAGTLFGDPRVQDLRDGLRKVMVDKVGEQPDAYNSLGIVGIGSVTFSSGSSYTGKLSFDQDKFSKALEANPDAVRSLFSLSTAGSKGVAVRAKEYLSNYTRTDGILTGRAAAVDKSVEEMKAQIKRWEEQILPKREERLRNQFLGLEKAMSSLQNQGNWLSQQVKSLSSGSNQ
ncbi:MAG TPA: flagellar filament capping protein FliD [Symbiobacteriaceae bacterium]|nr:flagellar filament capping protein FliD [Symbiobacteriaceae bacterium]